MVPRLCLAIPVCLASPALAEPLTYDIGNGGTATFYGQVNPAYLSFDDGKETDSRIVDNSHSNTRLGFTLDQGFENGDSLRFRFEAGLALPGTSEFSQTEEPPWDWDDTDLRHIDLRYRGSFGALSLGQGPMGSDGIAGNDLSGTTLVSAVATADTAGSYFWRQFDDTLSGISLSNVYADFDGGRKGRIRYDTPDLQGFRVAVAYGKDVLGEPNDNRYYDIGGFYSGEMGEVTIKAGLGFGWVNDGDDVSESWAGSISLLHDGTGLNGTFATGAEIDGARYAYGKIGWTTSFWDVGDTAFSADLYSGHDFVSDGSTSQQWGLQAAQTFEDQNVTAYLGYAEYAFDEDGGPNYQDASSFLAGLYLSF